MQSHAYREERLCEAPGRQDEQDHIAVTRAIQVFCPWIWEELPGQKHLKLGQWIPPSAAPFHGCEQDSQKLT